MKHCDKVYFRPFHLKNQLTLDAIEVDEIINIYGLTKFFSYR